MEIESVHTFLSRVAFLASIFLADAFVNVPDKFAKYFSPDPGEGD
jgi:hypothetical protein